MRINEDFKKIKKEVENRRSYDTSNEYKKPKVERIEFSRFVAQIYFKKNPQYPKGGYLIQKSWEQLKLKELGNLDEWGALKSLLAFIYKIKEQKKLQIAKIFMSLDTLPLIKDKNHKELVIIITDFVEINNKSLKFYMSDGNHIVNLSTFKREWLE